MTEARVEILRRLARRGATPQLQRALKKSRPVDIAAAVGHLAPAEQRLLFQQLPTTEETAEVVFRLGNDDLHVIVKALPFERLVKLLDLMEADDEADVIDRLPDDMREKVLAAIQKEDKQLVEEILAWPEDSAGGIMQPIAFRLREDQTCRDAIAALHEQQEHLETIFYVYVENEGEQLVGVTSLRALLTHSPSTVLRDIMTLDVISVSALDDQEDVARIASRYDLLAVPVVDENRHLLGIVTIDDVVDVIKEEALEDMMLMAGVGDAPAASSGSVISAARQRILWLGVTLLGGIGISEVVGLFHGALEQQAVLTGFIPVMLGTGGNVGTQAATVAVRNLALGNDADMGLMAMVFREARIGMLLGLAFAITLGGYALLRWSDTPLIGLSIAVALFMIVVVAAAVGTLVPLTLNRLGVDPAVATGPFVTSSIDFVAAMVYFTTTTLILGLH
ncbi:MAG: hypothetical protein RL071_3322 [Pseudomonadota bacterium]|jgi:magnesium transporter